MKTNEWHWARLKKDLLMDDPVVLYHLECGSFIMPIGTIVWARKRVNFLVDITPNPELLKKALGLAYKLLPNCTDYNDLLEPLE